MKISIIAIGTKMPSWICEGYQEYACRLPKEYQISLIEIPSTKRFKTSNLEVIKKEEGQKILNAISFNSYKIALEREGKALTSETLAKKLETWKLESINISFIIGGPEGLSQECCLQAQEIWSLSKLTLPHPLVRVVLAEQLYRAYSIIVKHPYHR